MSDRTKIAWCDASWNPVVGCSPAGIGCENCYAKRMASRLAKMPATSALYRGVGGEMKILFHGDVPLKFRPRATDLEEHPPVAGDWITWRLGKTVYTTQVTERIFRLEKNAIELFLSGGDFGEDE